MKMNGIVTVRWKTFWKKLFRKTKLTKMMTMTKNFFCISLSITKSMNMTKVVGGVHVAHFFWWVGLAVSVSLERA